MTIGKTKKKKAKPKPQEVAVAPESFAEGLRTRILKSKLTDGELAKLTIAVDGKGMTRSFISLFVSGKRSISIDRAEVLASAIGYNLRITKKKQG